MSDRGWTIEGGYRIDVFAEQDAVSADDVVALWTREGVVTPAEAERRVAELLLVATDEGRRPAAISTAYLQRNDQLRADMWYYRAFVAADHRMSSLALWLAKLGRDHLEQRFVSGEDRQGLGIVFEVENPGLKRSGQGSVSRYNGKALWAALDFLFVGENLRGDHVRVHYFPGALAPEPDHGSA